MSRDKETPVELAGPALQAAFVVRAGELKTIAEDLITTVRRDKVLRYFFGFISLVLVIGMAVNISNTRASKKNTKIIVSCTDPQGECYKNSQKSSGQSIEFINNVSIAAAYCAKQPENKTVAQIKICVTNSLAKK